LRRLVEFLNEKMADVEVLAVEVKQYLATDVAAAGCRRPSSGWASAETAKQPKPHAGPTVHAIQRSSVSWRASVVH
jgi:hypothetical protein